MGVKTNVDSKMYKGGNTIEKSPLKGQLKGGTASTSTLRDSKKG